MDLRCRRMVRGEDIAGGKGIGGLILAVSE